MRTDEEIIYDKGIKMVMNELNVFTLLSTL